MSTEKFPGFRGFSNHLQLDKQPTVLCSKWRRDETQQQSQHFILDKHLLLEQKQSNIKQSYLNLLFNKFQYVRARCALYIIYQQEYPYQISLNRIIETRNIEIPGILRLLQQCLLKSDKNCRK